MSDDQEDTPYTAATHPALWTGEDIGRLTINSGVAVCDTGAFFREVRVALPGGEYAVRLVRGDYAIDAIALVRPGATPASFEKVGEYGVDCGLSGFADLVVFEKVNKAVFKSDVYNDLIDPVFYGGEVERDLAMIPFDGSAFFTCRSGGGDGVYPVWAGKDASGTTVAVVTAF